MGKEDEIIINRFFTL